MKEDECFRIGNLPSDLNVSASEGAPGYLKMSSLALKQDIGQFGLAGKIWHRPYRILELGAGTGYVGIALAQVLKKPCHITITDLVQVVPLIKDNVCAYLNHQEQSIVSVDRCHWGNKSDARKLLEAGRFDLVVVSDCVYFPELFSMLMETLLDVCDAETEVVIGYKCRSLEKEVGFWQDYFGRYFEYEPIRTPELTLFGEEDQLFVFKGKKRQEAIKEADDTFITFLDDINFSYTDEYTEFLTELHENYCRDQPSDILQYCANFFNKKLEEERLNYWREHQNYEIETEQHPLAEGAMYSPDLVDSNSSSDLFNYDDEEDEEMDNFSTAPLNSIPINYNRNRRTSVSAESMAPAGESFIKKVILKTPAQMDRIKQSVGGNFLFKSLDEEHHQDVVDSMSEAIIEAGTSIIQQGDVGDYFYIVESGTFDCYITKDESEMKVTSYEEGGSFGELALMYNAPRAATIIATSDATVWALDRITFRTILMENTSRKRKMYESFLEEVPLLKSLEPYERHKIADALESVYFSDGEEIILQGDVGDQFYLIEAGHASVHKTDENGERQEVNQLTRGSYFGELALLNDSPRAATVSADGRLKCATLKKKAFTRLLGPVHEILKRNSENYHAILNQQP
ncbi:cyclic nucleotide-binding-like protein [Pilobolus umbonatus]|nr:cyclic nucleotide-binding-like protein [Pilobolus umbonatus]